MNKQALDAAIKANDMKQVAVILSPLTDMLAKQLQFGTMKKNVIKGIMKTGLVPYEVAEHLVEVAAVRAHNFGHKVA